MPTNYMTLTRQALYDLAWSTPMSTLAKGFGISDVALAKRCRAVDVPVPQRGYWARRAAGQDPPRTPLPKYRSRDTADPVQSSAIETPPPAPDDVVREGREPTVNFGRPATGPEASASTTPISPRESALRSQLKALSIASTRDLLAATAAVKRTAVALKYTRRRELSFARGERVGPTVEIHVDAGVLGRALLCADTLLRTAEPLGWTLIAPPAVQVDPSTDSRRSFSVAHRAPRAQPVIGQLLVEGERIPFSIEERVKEEPRVPTASQLARERREYRYHAPRHTQLPTGALRVVRVDGGGWSPRRKSWYDRSRRPVEEQIPDILEGFLELALEFKARRAKREREEREREEAEQRRRELDARRQANAELIVQLETQAGAWYRARILRAYLRALRRWAPGTEVSVKCTEQTIDFVEWAERYVNAMDPLHGAPRAAEFKREEYSWRASEHAKEELSRLSGHDWAKSWKV